MQLSKSTVEVLWNFANINDSILIKPGDRLVSFHNGGEVLANAKIEDTFTDRFGIYDLTSFLALTALVESPSIDTTNADAYVTISGDGTKFRYYVADESLINVPPRDELELPSVDLSFRLDENELKKVLRAASVFTLDTISVYSEDGGLYFGVKDPKQQNSNSFSVFLAKYDGPEIRLVISISKLTLMPGNYHVDVSYAGDRMIVEFRHLDRDLRYWAAPEKDSYVKK